MYRTSTKEVPRSRPLQHIISSHFYYYYLLTDKCLSRCGLMQRWWFLISTCLYLNAGLVQRRKERHTLPWTVPRRTQLDIQTPATRRTYNNWQICFRCERIPLVHPCLSNLELAYHRHLVPVNLHQSIQHPSKKHEPLHSSNTLKANKDTHKSSYPTKSLKPPLRPP